MEITSHAQSKLTAIKAEILNLKSSEFPHSDAEDALEKIEGVFLDLQSQLDDIHDNTDPDVVSALCSEISKQIAINLPLLGHVLRSTNVRNAFEFYGPLVLLARQLLGDEARLVLSSEWELSPFAYPPGFPHLRDFALIGLPATESSNALILPLCGHELGHLVWRNRGHESQIEGLAVEIAIKYIINNWNEYKKYFDGIQKDQIRTDFFAVEIWTECVQWALYQCEEVFCDFLGLRAFEESYLYAFQYIIAPYLGEERDLYYPSVLDRVHYLKLCSEKFEIEWPDKFEATFENEPKEMDQYKRFMVSVADAVVEKLIDTLCALVIEICDTARVPRAEEERISEICEQLTLMIPAHVPGSTLSEIIISGWRIQMDKEIWRNIPHLFKRKNEMLNELLLKSLEVCEFNYLINK